MTLLSIQNSLFLFTWRKQTFKIIIKYTVMMIITWWLKRFCNTIFYQWVSEISYEYVPTNTDDNCTPFEYNIRSLSFSQFSTLCLCGDINKTWLAYERVTSLQKQIRSLSLRRTALNFKSKRKKAKLEFMTRDNGF